ncbi:hypothetical protein [Hamadaea tsunoensis]|uniref:hypothetical protein n=1 Tax=Hamadaea tsunoensis TaxID=53368 RepID=UPI0004086022|nr:hypothetical protein [Hamadaea tsunoensis]
MRRLLFFYPRAYRRDRGPEILETLQEYAGTSRTRLAVNLIRHGLRTRLGRPASRTVVVWAALFTVACGLFAAAFGSWVGWQTIRPLHESEAAQVAAELLPTQNLKVDTDEPPAKFVIYGQPLGWYSVRDLLLGDGGEYGQSGVGAGSNGPADHPERDLATLRENLRRGGWEFREYVRPDYGHEVYAGRGDQQLDITFYEYNYGASYISLGMDRPAPALATVGGVLGFLAGAVGGFLLFGWASRRTRSVFVKLLLGFGLFFWWAPIVLAFPQMVEHHLSEWHYSWHPLWEWLGQPALSLPFLLGTGLLVLALAISALARAQVRRADDPVPG